MLRGKIIYLEGTSSAGKTTLAKTLQTRLSEPFFWLSGDLFWEIAPRKFAERSNQLFPKVEAATINTIKLFSDLGIDVIVDIVPVSLSNSMNLFLDALHEYPVIYICVTCPLEELRRREKERGDRRLGTGESRISWIAPQYAYDLVLDTHHNSTEECADQIIDLLDSPERHTAFKTLWSQRSI